MRWAVALIAALAVAASCALLPTHSAGGGGSSYPAGCADFDLSARRCEAIVNWAIKQAGGVGQVSAVELLGDPGCGDPDPHVLCGRTTRFVVRVRLTFQGGQSADESVFCGIGAAYSILCTETPEIRVGSIENGYRDVPCADENGNGCATPLPAFEPAAAAAAKPLLVPTLDVLIDHVGSYVVEVGRAVLPNGVLTAAHFQLADPKTQTFAVSEYGVVLHVDSIDPAGRPFDNYYRHGWHRGTEEVRVSLAFDVTAFTPGAHLQVRNLDVH